MENPKKPVETVETKVEPSNLNKIILGAAFSFLALVGRDIGLEFKKISLEDQVKAHISGIYDKAYVEVYGIPRTIGELRGDPVFGSPTYPSHSLPPKEDLDWIYKISHELKEKYSALSKKYIDSDNEIRGLMNRAKQCEKKQLFLRWLPDDYY